VVIQQLKKNKWAIFFLVLIHSFTCLYIIFYLQ
jgi:hypothetical protein